MSDVSISKPFHREYALTQKFGVAYELKGEMKRHMGVDWALPKLTPVLAAADGFVENMHRSYTNFDYGKRITLQHKGFETFYGHLHTIEIRPLQDIKKGQLLGYSGRTGFVRGVTGYHLHFGLKIEGRWVDAMEHIDKKDGQVRYIPAPGETLIPLFRLYNPETKDHFYTVSEKEAQHAALDLGYEDEGVIGFIIDTQK